jgi:predicted phage tail protein
MITVNLHGHLKDSFGTGHQFAVNTLSDVLKALDANFDDFTPQIVKDERRYSIVVDHKVDYGSEEMIPAPIGTNSEVDIIPYIEGSGGSGGWQVVAGVLLIAAGFIFTGATLGALTVPGGMMVSAGIGLIIGGVATLLAPDQEVQDDDTATKGSSFKNAKNLIGQGYPVPIGYGQLRIGSNLISAFFTNSYEIVSTARVWLNNEGVWQVKYSGLDGTTVPEGATDSSGTFRLDNLWYGDSLEGIVPNPGYDAGSPSDIYDELTVSRSLSAEEAMVYDLDGDGNVAQAEIDYIDDFFEYYGIKL